MSLLRYYGLYDLCIRACVPPLFIVELIYLCLVSCCDILIVGRPELDSGGATAKSTLFVHVHGVNLSNMNTELKLEQMVASKSKHGGR